MKVSHFLIPVGYEYLMVFLFSIPFGYIYYVRTLIPRQNRPSINMVHNVVDPNLCIPTGIQRFSHLDLLTKYQYLTGITILIPMGRFFDTMIEVDY